MLALKLGNSLPSSYNSYWTPGDESSCEGWYRHKVGITLNGSDVSAWADGSGNSRNMVQATDSEQPAYNSTTGALTFASGDDNNLQTIGQISLDDNFTIGIKMFPTSTNCTFLADNTTANELFKISGSNTISVKIDGSAVVLSLDSTEWGDDYVVITRISDVFTLYQNGTAQSSTPTLSGTADIDAIGIRKTDVNGFDGTIKEVQIYSSASAALTANINTRLSLL